MSVNDLHFIETGMFTFIEFLVCFDESAYKNYINDQCAEFEEFDFLQNNAPACCHTLPLKDGKIALILTFDVESLKSHSLNATCGLIVHECMHVLQKVKLYMDEKQAGVEFEAYFIQWAFQHVFDIIQREVFNAENK